MVDLPLFIAVVGHYLLFLLSPASDESLVSDVKLDEKASSSSVLLSPDSAKPTWGAELPSQVSCCFVARDLAG